MRLLALTLCTVLALAHLTAAPAAPTEILTRIEIPVGSHVKYEIDAATGRLLVDRFLATAVAYPANYGTLPGPLGGDADELDVLILTRSPILPGAYIRMRPVAVLPMIDGGEADEKILAVPVDAVDATYAEIRDLAAVPAAELARIADFFRTYKNLPVGSKVVEVGEWQNATAAQALITTAVAAAKL